MRYNLPPAGQNITLDFMHSQWAPPPNLVLQNPNRPPTPLTTSNRSFRKGAGAVERQIDIAIHIICKLLARDILS